MQLGDRVTWTSQAGGHAKSKEGEIVAIVDAKRDATYFVPAGMKLDGPGMWRNHESYLVQVGNKLYWPRVSQLKIVR